MSSQELINEDNPYGLLAEENPAANRYQPPAERSKEDPYYPDPYA
ncbi:MAG: hypothetical protein H6Q00_349 [Holophagaceae bacterium]|nr:hypothetical protein [Holophagaceae bacterium]